MCVLDEAGCGVECKKRGRVETCVKSYGCKSLERRSGRLGCGVMESLVRREPRVCEVNVASNRTSVWVWFGVLGGIPENRIHPQQKLLLVV